MKTLSLTQPWASLVALGVKQYETRSWSTGYRGYLAIHAAKRFPPDCRDLCAEEPFESVLREAKLTPFLLPTGAVLCVVRLVDCAPTGTVRPDSAEQAFGDFGPGRFAWKLELVGRFTSPIPAKGALGLWEWECSLNELRQVGLTCPRAEAVVEGLQAALGLD